MFDGRSGNDPYIIDDGGVYLGPPFYDPSEPCICPKGTYPNPTASSCICEEIIVLEPPISAPPNLACEPGYHAVFLRDGSQVCVPDATTTTTPPVTTTTTPPVTTTTTPPGTTVTPGTGGGIIDILPAGIVDEDGLIFGFSPLVAIGILGVGAYFLMSGGKK